MLEGGFSLRFSDMENGLAATEERTQVRNFKIISEAYNIRVWH